MGTDYYYRTNVCDNCKRFDERHVGKKSMGWTFHFRGHRGQPDGSPDIVSIADWAKLFKTTPGVLANEYGLVIENPLQFLADLERPSIEQQQLEDSPEWRGGWSPRPDLDTEWRDSEGFAFYDGEFS